MQRLSFSPYVDPVYSYSFGRSNNCLTYKTIGQGLDEVSAKVPDKIAIVSIHQGIKRTYKELNKDTNQLGKALYDLGIRKGDVISVWSANLYEYFVIQYAAAKIGAIYCSISPLNKVSELGHILTSARVKLLFMPGPTSPQNGVINDFHTVFGELDLQNKIKDLQHLVYLENDDENAQEKSRLKVQSYQRLFSSGNPDTLSEEMTTSVHPEDTCNIFFTSGTTGKPKGAASSHTVMLNAQRLALSSKRGIPFENERVICLPLPIFHAFAGQALAYALPILPFTVVLSGYRYTPESMIKAVAEYGCTDIWLVPTMVIDLLSAAREDPSKLSSITALLTGGASLTAHVASEIKRCLPNLRDIVSAYGATETSPVAISPAHCVDQETKRTTVGTALDFNEIKLINPITGSLVKHGETGEVCVRGMTMTGYYGEAEKTREVLKDGWYMTGDLGTMDSKGFVRINGRTKELIIRGGQNIYPREVEDLLHQHESVENVGVCGVKHDKLGEEVCAWIKRKSSDDGRTTKEELRQFCKDNISYYKVPAHILFVNEFPTTPSGKLQKFVMSHKSLDMIRRQKENGEFL